MCLKSIFTVLPVFLLSVSAFSKTPSSHRFLLYGEGDVMISDFRFLPKTIGKKIDKVREKKPTEAYQSIDLSEHIPEILNSFGLSTYKGIDGFGQDIQFEFSSAKLIHSLSKGDCHNYPDTFISLKSNSFKTTIHGKELIRYPKNSFIVFPKDTQKIRDKEVLSQLNKKLSKVYTPQVPTSQLANYYGVGNLIYALAGQVEMGESYHVYDCTNECKKLEYHLEYPTCGS